MEFTLLWAALTAVAFALLGTRIWDERLPDHPTDRLIGAATGGLIAGRLTAMIVQGINPLLNPMDIIIVRGGVHTGAATIGAIFTYLWSGKWRLEHLDATAPAALAGLAGWHAGCLWRGACLGSESTLPWAWAEPGSAIMRHPVELYAALALVAAALLVSRLPWHLLARSGAALALTGVIRLATEPMRPSITGGPLGWYVAAIVVGTLAAFAGRHLPGRSELQPS